MIVAVSGGADSVALLHLVMALRQEATPFTVGVAHLDHGVRGAEGAADAAFVRDLARKLDLPLLSGRRLPAGAEIDPVAADLTSTKISRLKPIPENPPSEDELRRARRAFYERKASEWGARRIAVGHTRDDQAETALLNLLRGSGSRGLGGIRRTTRLSAFKDARNVGDSIPIGTATGPLIIRPLLDIGRDELRDWLIANNHEWREDSTNQDPRYLRNRVRSELLPLMESLRPGARDTLARAATLLQDDNDLLDRVARTELKKLTLSSSQNQEENGKSSDAVEPPEAAKQATSDAPSPAGSSQEPVVSAPSTPAQGSSSLVLDARRLATLNPALSRRVVRIAAAEGTSTNARALSLPGAADRAKDGPPWAPGSRQVDAVLEMAATGKGGRIDLGRGHVAVLKQGQLTFEMIAGTQDSPAE